MHNTQTPKEEALGQIDGGESESGLKTGLRAAQHRVFSLFSGYHKIGQKGPGLRLLPDTEHRGN